MKALSLTLCFAAVPVVCETFKVGYIYGGVISDEGWNHMHNLGRILCHERAAPVFAADNVTLEDRMFESVVPETSAEFMTNLSRDGFNLIVATSFAFEDAIRTAALANTNTDFAYLPGSGADLPNFVSGAIRQDQSMYAAGVLAGGNTQTKRIGFVAPFPLPGVNLGISMLYIGAQIGAGGIVNSTYVEHKVDVLVVWLGTFSNRPLQREAAKRLHALGCDILVHNTDNPEIDLYAKEHDLLSVGQYNNMRHLVGDSVLTSTTMDFAPLYYDTVMLSYSGALRNTTVRDKEWYGYAQGGPVAHTPSFKASKASQDVFKNVVDKMKNGTLDPVCHPLIKNGVPINPGRCLTAEEVKTYGIFSDGPVYINSFPAVLTLLGEQCGNGTFYEVEIKADMPPTYRVTCTNCSEGHYANILSDADKAAGNAHCSPCDIGSYSSYNGRPLSECTLCPEGFFSAIHAATHCTPCPSGTTNVGLGNANCPVDTHSDDATMFIAVGASLGGLLLILVPLVLMRVLRDRKVLNELFSEKAIAHKCASSIAAMRLEDLDYIRHIDRPSDIIAAFILIMDNMKEYRRYLPLTLLAERCSSDSDRATEIIGTTERSSQHRSRSSVHSSAKSTATVITASSLAKQISRKNVPISSLGLVKRDVTFLVVNVCDFLKMFQMGVSAVVSRHSSLCEQLLSVFENTRGTPEAFSGDRFVGTYNSIRHLTGHQSAACHAVLSLPTISQSLDIRFSSSVSSGVARCGTVGGDRMKRFSFFGAVVPFSFALERYARSQNAMCLLDNSMAHEAVRFELRVVDAVSFRKLASTPIPLYTLLAERVVASEEWMYQLASQSEGTQKDVMWNKWAEHVIASEWEPAEKMWSDVESCTKGAYSCTRLVEGYLQRRFTVPVLTH